MTRLIATGGQLFLGAIALVVTIALTGCGLAQRAETKKQAEAANAEMRTAAETCDQKFPRGQQHTAVSRARCVGDAIKIIRSYTDYPDLLDQQIATRNLLAERWQSGKITQAQFDAESAQLQSSLVAEDERRKLAVRAVTAQEDVVSAARAPVSCTRFGNTVNCF